MGKYMRKGKGTGKVAVMEISQGSLGMRTRAKTLALEQDRKLASARNAGLKQQQHPNSCVVDPFQTSYLELRSRKLEKVVKEIEKPDQDGLSEGGRNLTAGEEAATASEVDCMTMSTAVVDLRIEREDEWHVEVVGSSQTPELSPKRVDDFDVLKAFAIASALSSPTTLDDARLSYLKSESAEEPLRLGAVHTDECGEADFARMALDGVWTPIEGAHSHQGRNSRRPKVEASYGYAAREPGISPMRRRYCGGNPVSSSSTDREGAAHECAGTSTRLAVDRQDPFAGSHDRIIDRRYMHTNLFTDADAIDELFAAPEATEREQGKRFTERYNYDIVNDLPLKGRFEWVAVEEPCSASTITQHQPDLEQQR